MKTSEESSFELTDGTKVSLSTLHEILKWVAGHKDIIGNLCNAEVPTQFQVVNQPVFRGVCFQKKEYDHFLKNGYQGKQYESWTTDFFVARDFAEYADGITSIVFKYIVKDCNLNISNFLNDPIIEEQSARLFPKLWAMACDMRSEDEIVLNGTDLHLTKEDIAWQRDFEIEA